MITPEITESLQSPEFRRRVWGYDPDEVRIFLDELRERLVRIEAERKAPGVAELAGVGEKVEEILAAARDAALLVESEAKERAAVLARDAEAGAAEVRAEAEREAESASEQAERTRSEADGHAERVRAEAERIRAGAEETAQRAVAELREDADREIEQKLADAEEEAEQMLRASRLELGRVQESIEELRSRRQMVLMSIERMRGNLGSITGEAEQGTSEFVAAGEESTVVMEADEEPALEEQDADPGNGGGRHRD